MVDLLIFHRRYVMSLGPVSLMVIGFQGHDYDFKGKVPRAFRAAHALRAARRHGDIRVLDMLLIRKDARGSIEQLQFGDLGEQERAFAGSLAGGLLGVACEGAARARAASSYGGLAMAEHEFGVDEAYLRQITRDIPKGKAASVVLVGQRLAVRLKD